METKQGSKIPAKPKKVFDLNQSFLNYLDLNEIDPEKTKDKTIKTMRHAYVAGMAQMYVVLMLEIPSLTDDEHKDKAIAHVANLLNDYFKEQTDDEK